MANGTIDQRITRLETRGETDALDMKRVLDYLDRNDQQNITIQRILSLMQRDVEDFKAYQKSCDMERHDQANRIETLENFRRNFKANIAVIAAIISFATTNIIEYLKK